MSFASEAKNELCRLPPPAACCRKAECYGLFLFGKSFSGSCVSLTTEHAGAARRMALLSAQAAGAITEVRSAVTRKREGRNVFSVGVEGDGERNALLSFFGHSGTEVSLRIRRANLENACCTSAFLRGAFLCCGTVADPQKEYQLEFAVPHSNLARDLSGLLAETDLNLQPGTANRRGVYVVYVKGGERVENLLTYMGAPQRAMEMMQVRMFKEVRNNVNRKTNFETANLDKTASAAAEQLLALQRIGRAPGGLESLPEDLQEMARLRLENPELSLRELGTLLSQPLSRSGVNHRLRRILEFARQLPAEESAQSL